MTVEDVLTTLTQHGVTVDSNRRVPLERSEARAYLRRWEGRGQGVLRGEQLQWTPYGRGKSPGDPGGVEGS